MKMKKMAAIISGVSGAMMAGAAWATPPAFTVTQPDFDYAQLGTYAGTILTALAAIWLIRKFIKMTNRS